mmetsp:Transcript_1620/g.4287  ORF Transcript_1620/g.4287 Transcript_1620/m.4287 type:complete len:86 (-) Transcript_1620:1928-2185(-)
MGQSKVVADLSAGTVAGASQLVVGHPFGTSCGGSARAPRLSGAVCFGGSVECTLSSACEQTVRVDADPMRSDTLKVTRRLWCERC